jgi:hypothetical protein
MLSDGMQAAQIIVDSKNKRVGKGMEVRNMKRALLIAVLVVVSVALVSTVFAAEQKAPKAMTFQLQWSAWMQPTCSL